MKRVLVKLLRVALGKENILEDLARANKVEVYLLDRNHPNPISKLNRHTEKCCRIDFVRLVVNYIVEYVIEL